MAFITEPLYQEYLQALLAGKRRKCHDIVSLLIADDMPIRHLYLSLFQRSLYEIGLLWEQSRISVAVEHLASNITENLFLLTYPKIFSSERLGKRAIISCAANEFHQIGGKMVADIFELHGWDTYFLGANTPLKDTIAMVREHDPDLVAFSLSMYFNLPHLHKIVIEIREKFPDLPIIVGGQGFRSGGAEVFERLSNAKYINSIDALEKMLMGGLGVTT